MKTNIVAHFCLSLLMIFAPVTLATDKSNSVTNTRFFTKVVGIISPFLEYKLTGEINKSKADTTNHYMVTYDDQNRVQEIQYFHGMHPSEDSYFYTNKVKYDYSDGMTSRYYYNKDDQPTSMWRHYYSEGEIHQEKFVTTPFGMELTLFDASGKRVTTGFNAYTFHKKDSENGSFIQYQLDDSGQPVVLTNYFPFQKSLITVDEHGHLKEIINLNYKTEVIEEHAVAQFSHVVFEFDKYGNELGWRFLDKDGNLVNRPSTIEDPGYAIWTYEFDWREREYGKFFGFEMNYFDMNNKRFCQDNGVCKTRIEANDFGDIIGQSFHKADGNLIVNMDSNFARVTIARDGMGRRIETRYYDEKGELRRSGHAIRRFEYSDNGSVSHSDFNAEGARLSN